MLKRNRDEEEKKLDEQDEKTAIAIFSKVKIVLSFISS